MRLWLLCILALACGGTGSGTPAGSVTGTWNSSSGLPGSGITMTLTQSGSTISGSGTQSVEAGASRSFTVTGSINGDQVTLGITYSDQSTATFQGTLSGNSMSGVWTPQGGTATPASFTR